MLDTYLQHWREFQTKRKLTKAANANFPCTQLIGVARVLANLVFVSEGKRDIGGYDFDHTNRTIKLTIIIEEVEMDPVIFEFGDLDILEAAYAAIDSFLSEPVNIPTPPSSGASDEDKHQE